MASVSKDGIRGWRVRFRTLDGKQRTVRLGSGSKKNATVTLNMIERLVEAKRLGQPNDSQTTAWLEDLDGVLCERLAKIGLIEQRRATRLDKFLSDYLTKRTDVSEGTILNMQQAKRSILQYFDPEIEISDITSEDGHDFRRWLETPKPDGAGLAEATASRRCKRAKQFFESAKRSKLIDDNPFEGVRMGSQANDENHYFVTVGETDKLLNECRSNRQRLIITLVRYNGLRIPSELAELRWSEVDWEKKRMVVRAPKTKRYRGKEFRVTPIWPEVLPYLEQAWDKAEEGNDYILPGVKGNENLRTWLTKLILRAGLNPWPRLWVNMRSSRATELAELYPGHVCEAWLGHSEIIAKKHYRQVTDSHFEKAISGNKPDRETSKKLGHKTGHTGATKPATQGPQNRPRSPGQTIAVTLKK